MGCDPEAFQSPLETIGSRERIEVRFGLDALRKSREDAGIIPDLFERPDRVWMPVAALAISEAGIPEYYVVDGRAAEALARNTPVDAAMERSPRGSYVLGKNEVDIRSGHPDDQVWHAQPLPPPNHPTLF